MDQRWAVVAAYYDGTLPPNPAAWHARTLQSLEVIKAVCLECQNHADGGETLFGESFPKSKRGDGFAAMIRLIAELDRDQRAGARLAEQFIAVLLLWVFPDFASVTGCSADAFANIELDLFGSQRRGKSGARSSVVKPALHPMELWAKYAARPLQD